MSDVAPGLPKPRLDGSLEQAGFDIEEWAWLQRELTRELLISSDRQLDLSTIASAKKQTAVGLRAVLASDLLFDLDQGAAGSFIKAKDGIEVISRYLAKLGAEQHILKAGLAEHRRFVFPGEEVRPVSGLPEDSVASELQHRKAVVVPLASMALGRGRGHGWHSVMSRESGRNGYWSGPQPQATLVLPSIGVGDVRVVWDFDVVDASQVEALSVAFNGQPVSGLTLQKSGARRWHAAFTATIHPQERSSFSFLQFTIGERRSLPLKDNEPPTLVGICVEAISIFPIEDTGTDIE